MQLTITSLPLPGLQRIERRIHTDERGSFARLFCSDELAQAGWNWPIAQINHSFTARRGTVRGLHYQRPPHAECKLVDCLRGEVWDVAVDLRAGSPTFLQWHAEKLSAGDRRALLIPPGFAHGFQALTDDAAILYCHSAPHVPQAESGVHPLDPQLAIAWPLEIGMLSARDAVLTFIEPGFAGIAV